MNRQTLQPDAEAAAQLGEPLLVCRISRKTLVWGFLVASLPCGFGVAVLLLVLKMLLEDWSRDLFGAVVLLAIGVLSLWGGRVLWRKTDRLRHAQAVVHAGGISYHDGSTCLTCRWDQVEDVRWKVANHYEETSLAVGGVFPIPGTAIQRVSHTSHRLTVRRKDGDNLVFTDELQNIVELARAIQQQISRNIQR
jgi:hypothetical protein